MAKRTYDSHQNLTLMVNESSQIPQEIILHTCTPFDQFIWWWGRFKVDIRLQRLRISRVRTLWSVTMNFPDDIEIDSVVSTVQWRRTVTHENYHWRTELTVQIQIIKIKALEVINQHRPIETATQEIRNITTRKGEGRVVLLTCLSFTRSQFRICWREHAFDLTGVEDGPELSEQILILWG
jgi:hypothetical protein